MENCKDPSCSSAGRAHKHIELSREDIEAYKGMQAASKLQAAGAEIERTRTVDIHNHADLLDHLSSNNGHMMGRFANWRNTHEDKHIPNVRPSQGDDRELSHQELIALHHHDHNKYPEDLHTTVNGEHFHH